MKYILLIFACYIILLGCQENEPKAINSVHQPSPDMTTFKLTSDFSKFDTSDAFLINGMILKQGERDSISFIPYKKNNLDTFFYRTHSTIWDTIVCKFLPNHTYYLSPNECCGGFDVNSPNVKVTFKLEKATKKRYLGSLGGSDILLSRNKDAILTDHCLGPMAPNIRLISLLEVEESHEKDEKANRNICFYQDSNTLAKTDFYYIEKKSIVRFLYMPSKGEMLEVSFNPQTGKCTIKLQENKGEKTLPKAKD